VLEERTEAIAERVARERERDRDTRSNNQHDRPRHEDRGAAWTEEPIHGDRERDDRGHQGAQVLLRQHTEGDAHPRCSEPAGAALDQVALHRPDRDEAEQHR